MRITYFLISTIFALVMASGVQLSHPKSSLLPKENLSNANPVTKQDSTKLLKALVKDASQLVRKSGEKAFPEFRKAGSRWRKGETYIFVLDTEGNMLVHADPEMENKNQLELKDLNGKPIIRGLLEAATADPAKPEGWYHYEWPVPGGLLPRWKSSYVQLVKAPSGKSYVVGSGMYNNRMEREFVVDMVNKAVAEIEKNGEAAYKLFYNPAGPYRAKDAYLFAYDPKGINLVNAAFPSLEGQNLIDIKDTQGTFLIREIIKTAQTKGSGWVDYMWPKPGESVPSQKSTYVRKATLPDGKQVAVGCGVYLADAPKAKVAQKKISATELMTLVRQAAAELEKRGEKAFPEFSKKGSKWYQNDTYLFVHRLDGGRIFQATEPQTKWQQDTSRTDAVGRPVGKMFMNATASPEGEGWVHYQYPEPGDIFPTWKSSFVKRVTFPSGEQYIVGSGIYNMQLDKAMIEDVVNRAAALVEKEGKVALDKLRDKKGPFYFMDTYVFVETPEGVTLSNPAQPSLEGRNLINEKDLKGKLMVREYIDAAMKHGAAWVDYYWYKPGENTPAQKHAYVKKVQHGNETYIVGSGYYPATEEKKAGQTRKTSSGQ